MEIIYGFQNPDRTTIEVMTEQQALQDDFYHKIYKEENGLIKKIEHYSDQNLFGVDYYLDLGEDESQVLNELFQSVDYVSIFERKTPVETYFIERERRYDKKEPSSIGRHMRVYDVQDRLVCYVLIDDNDNPYTSTTQKYLYTDITTIGTDDTSSTDFFYLEFNYDDDEILGVDVNTGHTVDENKYLIDDLENMDEVMQRFGVRTSEYYSYYLHANWMP